MTPKLNGATEAAVLNEETGKYTCRGSLYINHLLFVGPDGINYEWDEVKKAWFPMVFYS
jgi:hypothetical protein